MSYPLVAGDGGDRTGPAGYTYAGLFVRVGGRTARTPEDVFEAPPDDAHGRRDDDPARTAPTRDGVLEALRALRFSGWLGRTEDGWVVVVPASGDGAVATGRRGVVDLAATVAADLTTTVVAVRVVRDRQLLLVVHDGPTEVGRYVSDPSVGRDPDDDVLPDPIGVEHAEAFAVACGRAEDAEDLAELLAEELDVESVIESERLSGVLRVLGLPGWLVAAPSLPRDVPAGPRASELTRLGAGADGVRGRVLGRAAELVRRRRAPADPVPDAPPAPPMDPWLM